VTDRRFAGRWWLSDNQSNQVPGVFTHSPTAGGKLELLGTFGLSIPIGPHVILGQVWGARVTVATGYKKWEAVEGRRT
jgi:hypothetical protein